MRVINHGTSIIVCAHNRLRDLTIPCVESIQRNTLQPYELILVDDGSTDGTMEYFRSQSRKACRLEGGGHGPGIARNMGLMAVREAEQIVFIDNDALMPPGWLGRLIDGQRVGGAGIVGALPSDEAGAVQAVGLTNVNEVGFGCALLTAPVYRAVGFFDPALTWGAQDTDYCFRAKEKGFQVHLMPDLIYQHRAHGTTNLANRKRQQSIRRFFKKWPRARSMLRPR